MFYKTECATLLPDIHQTVPIRHCLMIWQMHMQHLPQAARMRTIQALRLFLVKTRVSPANSKLGSHVHCNTAP
jgi:hypothetical protein